MKALMACFTLVVCLGGIYLLGQPQSLAIDNPINWPLKVLSDSNEPNEPDQPPVESVWTVEEGETDPNAPEDPNEEPMGEE